MNAQTASNQENQPLKIHPNLSRLVRYFAETAPNKTVALQRDFNLEALYWLFGCFYAVKVIDGGADYRFGYCGTCWQSFFGFDPSEKLLSEVENIEQLKTKRAEFDAVVAAKRLHYTIGCLVWPEDKTIRFDRVILPFADNDGRISMLLVAAQGEGNLANISRFKIRGYPRIVPKDTFWSGLA